MKKVTDIIEEAQGIACPAKRTLYVVSEFLTGPMCGKCYPCSFGCYEARLRLKNITEDMGSDDDIAAVKEIATQMSVLSMCKKGKDVADFVLSTIDDKAFAEHVRGLCDEKQCTAFIEYRNVPDKCIRCGKCQEVCKFDAIIGEKQISYKCCFLPFEIRQKRCTKCGECIKVCPANAIVVVNIEQVAGTPA